MKTSQSRTRSKSRSSLFQDGELEDLVGWARYLDRGTFASSAERDAAVHALADAADYDLDRLHRAWLLGLRRLGDGELTRTAADLLRSASSLAGSSDHPTPSVPPLRSAG